MKKAIEESGIALTQAHIRELAKIEKSLTIEKTNLARNVISAREANGTIHLIDGMGTTSVLTRDGRIVKA